MTQKTKAFIVSFSFPFAIVIYFFIDHIWGFYSMRLIPTGCSETKCASGPDWIVHVNFILTFIAWGILIVGLYFSIYGIKLLRRIKKEIKLSSQHIN